MWPSDKDIPLFVGVPVIMTHRVRRHNIQRITVLGPILRFPLVTCTGLYSETVYSK